MALVYELTAEGVLHFTIDGPWPSEEELAPVRRTAMLAWNGGTVLLDLRAVAPEQLPRPAEVRTQLAGWLRIGMPTCVAILVGSHTERIARWLAELKAGRCVRTFDAEEAAMAWLRKVVSAAPVAPRAIVDADQPDDACTALALRYVAATASAFDCAPIVMCRAVPHGLDRLLGPDASYTLRTRYLLEFEGTTFALRLVSPEGRQALNSKAVVALWLNDRELSLVEDAAPPVLCVVPWLRSQCRQWIASAAPVDLIAAAPPSVRPGVLLAPRVADASATVLPGIW